MSDPLSNSQDVETSVEVVGDVARATVTGELDAHAAPDLERVLTPVAERGPSLLVLNVGGVGFVDSSGLRVLLGLRKRLVARGGRLRLDEPTPSFRRLLELTGLLDELTGLP